MLSSNNDDDDDYEDVMAITIMTLIYDSYIYIIQKLLLCYYTFFVTE